MTVAELIKELKKFVDETGWDHAIVYYGEQKLSGISPGYCRSDEKGVNEMVEGLDLEFRY